MENAILAAVSRHLGTDKYLTPSVISRWHRVFYLPDELNSEFGDVVTFESVLDEPAQHFDVYHLEGALDGAAQDVGVTEVVAGVRQLHKLRKWVVVKEKAELVGRGAPSRHCWTGKGVKALRNGLLSNVATSRHPELSKPKIIQMLLK